MAHPRLTAIALILCGCSLQVQAWQTRTALTLADFNDNFDIYMATLNLTFGAPHVFDPPLGKLDPAAPASFRYSEVSDQSHLIRHVVDSPSSERDDHTFDPTFPDVIFADDGELVTANRNSICEVAVCAGGGPAPTKTPDAQAQTEFFANHARAFSEDGSERYGSPGTSTEGNFRYEHYMANALSKWVDVWQFTGNQPIVRPVELAYHFDMLLSYDSTPVQNGGVGTVGDQFPVEVDTRDLQFAWLLSIVNLDDLIECPNVDECGHAMVPVPVAGVMVTADDADIAALKSNPGGLATQLVEETGVLKFSVFPNDRYAVLGALMLFAKDGFDIDAMNTGAIDGLVVPEGLAFSSDALSKELGTLNVSTVPLPAAAWLLLPALGILSRRMRR